MPLEKPFVLAVYAVVLDDRGQVLLIRRSSRSRHQASLWDLPGGKCESAEEMQPALLREVAEETGLSVRIEGLVGSSQREMDERIVTYLIFEARVTGGVVRLSEEHDNYEWVPRENLDGAKVAPQFQEVLKTFARSVPSQVGSSGLDHQWYRLQLDGYARERPKYLALASSLNQVLNRAVSELGLLCLVQTRTKTVPSFAEKLLRPGRSYQDPLHELIDLCGARIVTLTLGDVSAVCRYIEDHFDVSWPDSGDKLDSLGLGEFGYRSRHYVVTFRPDAFPEDIVPRELLGLRAEIQVRTLLQHAWADLSHDLSYKSRVKLPRNWQRELARLAAVLEDTDEDFERVRIGLRQYTSSHGTTLTGPRLREEIEKHRIILEALPKPDLKITHDLARMAMALEDWDLAVRTLEPYHENGPVALVRDLGVSLCKLHRRDPEGDDFARGQSLLEHATEHDPTDVDARASLAGSWRARERASLDDLRRLECRTHARDHYRKAFELDPSDPYALGNYLEYEIADHPEIDITRYLQPSIEAASRRCHLHIEAGINLPWAHFDLGKFLLMLRRPYEALREYARGIEASSSAFFLESALSSFETLEAAKQGLPGLDWSQGLLRLALSYRFDQPAPSEPAPSRGAPALTAPVLIVVGYCGSPCTDEHRALLTGALRDFQGTILSGGTRAGVSALVGEWQETHPDTIHAIGYHPAHLSAGVTIDDRYAEHRTTPTDTFSPREPLLYLADILDSSVPLDQVRLLVLGGDRLASCECQMALALGLAVGHVETVGTEVQRQLSEPPWSGHPRLFRLPPEIEAIRSFLKF